MDETEEKFTYLRQVVERAERHEGPLACSADYFHLADRCNYCEAKPEIVRVTLTWEGDVLVSTLCLEHAKGEARHGAEQEGFVCVAPGSKFLNPGVYGEIPEKLLALPFYDETTSFTGE